MCEFTDRIKTLVPQLSRCSAEELFPPYVQNRYPFYWVKEKHCLACGTWLPYNERRPQGRTTRCMCSRCYETLIVIYLNEFCFICGGPLPAYKVHAQTKNPREISENIHDGPCLDYHTLIHCKVVGDVHLVLTGIDQPLQERSIGHEPKKMLSNFTGQKFRALPEKDTWQANEKRKGMQERVIEIRYPKHLR